MKKINYLWLGAIAVCAYLLYATDGCDHSPEFPRLTSGSADAPITLRAFEVQLTGTGGIYQKVFSTQLYNGTDWTFTRVDVILRNTKTFNSRRFRLSQPETKLDYETAKRLPIKIALMKPYSTCTFEAPIGDFLDGLEKGDWSWDIVEAYGFRE
jgi:hypothetical protein